MVHGFPLFWVSRVDAAQYFSVLFSTLRKSLTFYSCNLNGLTLLMIPLSTTRLRGANYRSWIPFTGGFRWKWGRSVRSRPLLPHNVSFVNSQSQLSYERQVDDVNDRERVEAEAFPL